LKTLLFEHFKTENITHTQIRILKIAKKKQKINTLIKLNAADFDLGEKNTLIEAPPPPSFGTPRRRALSARIQELNRSLLEERDAQQQNSSSDNEDSR